MKTKRALLILLLLLLLVPSLPVNAEDVAKEGPWADELFFKIYLSPEPEYLALKTGEINLMDWELPAEKVADALADPNILTNSTADLGYYQIDFNHQRWPTSDVHFRRACAHLVDKARIETDVLQGFGYRLESVVPVVMGSWSNPDTRTYEYSPAKAAEELELGGFVDTDGDGIRNDPITGENMAEVIFYIRIDDPERKEAGQWLADELKALGVPVYDPVVERAVCSQEVMLSSAGEWNVYTGGWGIGRDPDHLTDLYHSKEFDPEVITGWRGYNYGGFMNDTFDNWADILKTASTYEDVLEAAYKCQEIMAEQVTVIPMYGHIGVKAYRKEWTDTVNMVGTGINSWWSCYNMHPIDMEFGGRIEYGIKSDIETLNPLTAAWTYTWEVLDKIYETPYTWNPYNMAEDWPWLTESWEIEDWTNPEGTPGLKVTFHFVEDAYWHDGVPFTGEDLKFTYEYIREFGVPRYLPYVQFIEELVLVDDYTLEVYQNTTSYFAFHYLNGPPVLPKHIWEKVGANWQDYDPVAEGELVGLGPWKFVSYVPGEYVHLVANEKYWKFPDRFYQGLSMAEIRQAGEISSLRAKLDAAAAATEEQAATISELSAEISDLQSSTLELLEASAEDIEAITEDMGTLQTQMGSLSSEVSGLNSKATQLEAGLSGASNIGYASIALAVIIGAVAVFLSRRGM
ncbi:MAG: ABC transporter substrate-binding protein [Candidatus Bathyarchaeota archaeon]|nr:ABC transporter substrate-binding protein [Candidatus Bathyarchaeota archaeon]